MNNSLKLLVGITTLFFVISISCKNRVENKSINGTWKQHAYGRILEIDDSTYTYYNTTENSCLPLVSGKFKERWEIINFNENELILNPGGIVNYRFKRIDNLPKICEHKNHRTDKSAVNNFKVFWNTFNKHYAFFEKRNIVWANVKEKYLPLAKKIESDKELHELFIEIIKPFNDGHIKLDVPDSLLIQNKNKAEQNPDILTKSKDDVKSDIIRKYVSNPKSYNKGIIQWGYLKNSKLGYILISDMNNFSHYVSLSNLSKEEFNEQYNKKLISKSPMEQFSDELAGVEYIMNRLLKDFSDSKGIIVDLRFNGGGYERVALKLLSYFVVAPKHVLSVKAKLGNGFTKEQEYILKPSENNYKGQIFLLTSRRTASAAEIFALGALAYPGIKSYGSSTNGIFSEILWKNLPNGWEFSLSNEVYSDSKGNEYEIIGVPVNQDMNYPKDPNAFYNSFYKDSLFNDFTIEKILKEK